MKRVLLSTLVVGLLAAQASADMYTLDVGTARLFRQMNTPNAVLNQLYLVIDKPGTVGSTVRWQVDPGFDRYTNDPVLHPMQLEEGYLGQLATDQIMSIGVLTSNPELQIGDGVSYDSFGAYLANDDDDEWAARLYVVADGVTYTDAFTPLAPIGHSGSVRFLTLSGWSGDVSEFGFQVEYQGALFSDNFHISAVPVPGAVLLGALGLLAAGVKLRRLA